MAGADERGLREAILSQCRRRFESICHGTEKHLLNDTTVEAGIPDGRTLGTKPSHLAR